MKLPILVLGIGLSGCAWFHAKKPVTPDPAELVVTGAPVGSTLWVDGVGVGQPKEAGNAAQVVDVVPGTHIVEVKSGEAVVYREDIDVELGKKRVITVLSGANRY